MFDNTAKSVVEKNKITISGFNNSLNKDRQEMKIWVRNLTNYEDSKMRNYIYKILVKN